ncbi:carbohydrate kinase [Pantoea sp. Fr-CA_6]|uniref:glycine-rich domain-containing protein n=1 Tax=Pantoea sp. Fr-CA_6 TaxID=2929505 RepID=UPI00211979F7|nr:carbohydrate kinase [Pantoea sp. Fr-CA_6]
MHRIDTPTAQVDKFGAGKNGFTGGNPQTGELPTALDASFFDSVQEEISGVIEAAGLKLIKAKNDQLLNAINLLVSSGRLMNVRVFIASGNYTPSAGTKRIKVTVVGGGGGGGGSAATDANTRSCGAGGGAGNTAISLLDVSSLTFPVSINVGTAGAAGAAGGGSGGSGGQGGTTTFGTYINATGGFGGGGGSLASDSLTAVTTNGGTSAAPTTGNILNQRGSAGLQGIVGSNAIVSGAGGASSLGGGGNPVAAGASTAGENGIYGGGGSGSISIKSSQIGRAGGAGGLGVVVIEEYA